MQRFFSPAALKIGAIIGAFFLAGFIIYAPVLNGDFLTWDDTLLVRDNPNVQHVNAQTIKNVFTSYDPELYIPLTFLSYQIDGAIGGMTPMIFHVTNLVFHILNALLVVLLLYLLIGNKWLALGLGAIFLLHPLNVESAAWISGRKDTLSTFFFLLSLIAWIQWRGSDRKIVYAASLALFLLGLLSKVMVITLPVILILFDLLERRPLSKKMIVEKIPFFALAVIFGIVALLGKTSVLVTTTTGQKILMACKSTVFYLFKFILPVNLSVMHPYNGIIRFSSPDFFVPVLLVLLLLGVVAWTWKRYRLLSFGLIFFLLTLAPTFTNFAKGGDMYIASDRYAYIPMIGLLIVIGVLIERGMKRPTTVRAYTAQRNGMVAACAILLAFYGYGTAVQASAWRTSEALYNQVLSVYPNARAAHNNLGMEYFMRNEPDAAIQEFDAALSIRSDAKTKANRAAALVMKGQLDEALLEYEEVQRLDSTLPDSYYGIGNIYQKRGEYLRAAVQYRAALAAQPDYANALNNLGAVYIQLQDWDNAIATLKESIRQRPDFVESYYNIAGAYEKKGMKSEAEEMYRKAVELHPGDADALASLATLVYDRGDIDGAAQLLRQALTVQDSNPIAIGLVMRMKKDGVAE
jgi:tetratricopeptide (TPR) repeat protein